MTKTIAIGDLFTDVEIAQAVGVLDAGVDIHQRLLTEIVEPAMQRINKRTRQDNSPSYLAYALEYAARQGVHKSQGSKVGLGHLQESER